MDLAHDERAVHLNEQIQKEKDPAKLLELANELLKLLDEKKPVMIPHAVPSSKP
jgi:hypothetical protein